jgi:CRP-like cAMP-binding protein/CheY-like chemotaxis protein
MSQSLSVPANRDIADRRVLVVEDDFFLAHEIAVVLKNAGVEVIGPVPSVEQAMPLLQSVAIDSALLDVQLRDETIFPIAAALRARGLPFTFVTGYSADFIPPEFQDAPRLEKPVSPQALIATLLDEMSPVNINARPIPKPGNLLLRAMGEEVTREISGRLEPVALRLGAELIRAGEPAEYAIFPESGLCSVLLNDRGHQLEVGLIGFEGFVFSSLASGRASASLSCRVQVAGEGLRIKASVLMRQIEQNLALWKQLLKYEHVLHSQLGGTALAHAAYKVEQRVARWILMSMDRVGPEIPIVHEALGLMLHIRRAGVTNAIHMLEGERAIRATRGRILVRDRPMLELLASGSYGLPEAEYKAVFGLDPVIPDLLARG